MIRNERSEPGDNYHDPAAAIFRDGRLMFTAEEERFSQVKGAPGAFPAAAIEFHLAAAGISVDDIDTVAIGYDPAFRTDRLNAQVGRIRGRLGRVTVSGYIGETVIAESTTREPRSATARRASRYSATTPDG
ncbi:carbamoyltransferase N-terminal domain-containing protein [Actinomadura latina]|uniref:carbamoyltransferase N-terminal domain-containing protein n=1 Tax=Actinomadura latina TaxID=163603 RepID=UPI00350E5BF4